MGRELPARGAAQMGGDGRRAREPVVRRRCGSAVQVAEAARDVVPVAGTTTGIGVFADAPPSGSGSKLFSQERERDASTARRAEAHRGDVVEVSGLRVGDPRRMGELLEVLSAPEPLQHEPIIERLAPRIAKPSEVQPFAAARSWRSTALEQAGRAAVVAVAVLAVTPFAVDRSPWADVTVATVLGLIWFVGLDTGFASSRTTLAALGPRVAVVRGILLGLVLATAAGAWIPSLSIGIGPTFALAGVMLVLVSAWQMLAERFLPPQRILLIGPWEFCLHLMKEFRQGGGGRFTLAGIVDDGHPHAVESLLLGTTAELSRIVATTRPDLVALAPGCNRPEAFAQLLDSATSGFKVLELSQLYEHAFGRVPVRELTRAWFMGVLHLYQRPYSRLAKRTMDVAGAVFLFLLDAPIFPLLVIVVRRTGRPILLKQNRVGEHGELFTMYKFRTMRVDAETPGRAVWASRNDPRATDAGRVMRRLRVDELPQIWNVLKGEMSLVGPRPERPEFIDELLEAVPYWDRRHLVKPGITGWAQVNRGYTADTKGSLDKLSYDLWYIRHRSLTVDLVICARTLNAVLRGDRPRRTHGELPDLDPLVALPRHTTSAPVEVEQL